MEYFDEEREYVILICKYFETNKGILVKRHTLQGIYSENMFP